MSDPTLTPAVDLDEPAGPPAGSPLFSIRQAAAAVPVDDSGDVVDLEVPRWQDQLAVHVRYQRIDHRVARKHLDVPEKKRKADPHGWDLTAAQNLLIEACVGIFVLVDGTEYAFNDDDPQGHWPSFDDTEVLGRNLGRPIATPRDAVKAIYLADGDILTASAAYMEHFGYDNDVDLIRGN